MNMPVSQYYNDQNVQALDIDFFKLLQMLWRRKLLFISVIFLGFSFTILSFAVMKPRYSANSLIMLKAEHGYNALSEVEGFLITPPRSDSSITLNETEVLKSRTLARQVVDQLSLLNDSEFNGKIRDARKNSRISHSRQFKTASVYPLKSKNNDSAFLQSDIDMVINNFSNGLKVRSIPGSDVIRIEYISLSASKAALIANTIVDVYMAKRLRDNSRSFEKMTQWLGQRMAALNAQVQEAEQEAENYRAQYNLTRGVGSPAFAMQAENILEDLNVAQQELFESQKRLDQLLSDSSHAGNLKSIAHLVDLNAFEDLRRDEARTEANIAKLSARYGFKHPLMIKERSALKKIRSSLDIEIEGLVDKFEDEVDFIQSKVDQLQTQYEQATLEFNDDSEAMIRLRELEGEVEATKSTLDSFKTAYQRAQAQKDLQDPQARVISYAVIAQTPSFPNKALLLAIGLGLSTFLGLFIILILEKAHNTFRTGNELQDQCGIPCFSLIPQAKIEKGEQRSNYVLSYPSSIVAEAVRTLRVVLNLQARSFDRKKTSKVIAVTSSFSDEGKTTLSIWLARLSAQSGEKVIVIDTDLRKPNIHKSIGASNEHSVVEVLTDQKNFEDVIYNDKGSGADVVFGRSVPNSAINLLSSKQMEDLVENLKERYDLVILDMPACLPVSDSRVVSMMADQILYVVHWNKTRKEDVSNGIKQLKDMNLGDKIAFVMQHVDLKRYKHYGHSDILDYYK